VLQAGELEAPTKPKGRPRKRENDDEELDNNNDLTYNNYVADAL